MAVTRGSRFGPYEILEPIGAGGMGEVYRARDTRLDRIVAVKVLPGSLAADAQFRERFEREARTISQLNHPHICTLHDLGREAGVDFLVMEFVDGETLEQVLAGPRAMRLDDTIAITRQIASALDAAHERGIVHRDLKPANVKITADGAVKVLDFGLAKAIEPIAKTSSQLSMSPTMFAGATQAGVILGTAAYMSPEQARGLPVDKRTDIWAFGCVLYEMLTGRQAFRGETATDIIASIVREEPDWSALPAATPPALDRLVRRCLQKDPRKRLRDIADAVPDLDAAERPVPEAAVAPPRPADRSPWRAWAAVAVAAAMVMGAFVGGRAWAARAGGVASGAWTGERLAGSVFAFGPRVSPDGQTVAFQAMVGDQTEVGVMRPQAGSWTVLGRDKRYGGLNDLAWSRDGSRIFFDAYFDVPQGVFSVSALGGEPRLLLEKAVSPLPLADGTLLVTRINASRVGQLHRLWLDSGRLEPLPAIVGGRGVSIPAVRVFPDGREAVFFGRPAEDAAAPRALYTIDVESKRVRRIAPPDLFEHVNWGLALAVTPDGRGVRFARHAGSTFEIVEVPRDGSGTVRRIVTLTAQPLFLDIAADGSMYLDQLAEPPEIVWWAPAAGRIERQPLPDIYADSGAVAPLPDGRVLVEARPLGRERVMVHAPGKMAEAFVDTPEPTAFPAATLGPDRAAFLIGAPPSRKVAIAATADGHVQRRLSRVDGNTVTALAGSPDGRTLFYVSSGVVWAVPADESAEPKRIHDGDSVAVDPHGEYLVVKLEAGEKMSLVKVSLGGGPDVPIPMTGDLRLTLDVLSPTAVAADGRIVARVGAQDTWNWPAGIIDPRTGSVQPAPRGLGLDMLSPGWTAGDRIVTFANSTRSTIWRFAQQGK